MRWQPLRLQRMPLGSGVVVTVGRPVGYLVTDGDGAAREDPCVDAEASISAGGQMRKQMGGDGHAVLPEGDHDAALGRFLHFYQHLPDPKLSTDPVILDSRLVSAVEDQVGPESPSFPPPACRVRLGAQPAERPRAHEVERRIIEVRDLDLLGHRDWFADHARQAGGRAWIGSREVGPVRKPDAGRPVLAHSGGEGCGRRCWSWRRRPCRTTRRRGSRYSQAREVRRRGRRRSRCWRRHSAGRSRQAVERSGRLSIVVRASPARHPHRDALLLVLSHVA